MISILTSITVSTPQSRLERSMTQMVITLDIFSLHLKVGLCSPHFYHILCAGFTLLHEMYNQIWFSRYAKGVHL